ARLGAASGVRPHSKGTPDRAAAETEYRSGASDAARHRCSLPRGNPVSDPFPRRLFDPAVSEERHDDDQRQVDRVSNIAVPQPGSQKDDVLTADLSVRKEVDMK